MQTLEPPDERPKKAKPAKKNKTEPPTFEVKPATPETKSRFNDWEAAVFAHYVNNAQDITKKEVEAGTDEIALKLGKQVIAAMRETGNWLKRSSEDKYDFLMRFNLKAEGVS